MGIRDWMNGKQSGDGASGSEKLPLQLRDGLRIPDSQMNDMERQVYARIEDRYRRRAHMQVEGNGSSDDGQRVSRAVDGLIKTLKAREQGRPEEWEKLSTNVDKAICCLRQELRAQEKSMEHAKGVEHITRRRAASWER